MREQCLVWEFTSANAKLVGIYMIGSFISNTFLCTHNYNVIIPSLLFTYEMQQCPKLYLGTRKKNTLAICQIFYSSALFNRWTIHTKAMEKKKNIRKHCRQQKVSDRLKQNTLFHLQRRCQFLSLHCYENVATCDSVHFQIWFEWLDLNVS